MTTQELNTACDILWDIIAPYVNTSKDCEVIQYAFRKAMTEKANPLFEQTLANVNPETKAEVRKNMDAVLLWHKVSEELPKENTHILMARKAPDGNYMIEAMWYPEPPITNDMDYWMLIPELPEEG